MTLKKYPYVKHQTENNHLDSIEISVYYTSQEGMTGFDWSDKKVQISKDRKKVFVFANFM